MRRFFISGPIAVGTEKQLEGDSFHHIFEVCRQQIGDQFELVTAEGKAYFSKVLQIQKKRAVVMPLEVRELPKPRQPWINLVLSMPKFSNFDLILEKSVELGVARIQMVVSDYSYIKSLKSFPHEKQGRWLKIIQQATQQSGRGNLLELTEVQSLDHFLDTKVWLQSPSAAIFAYEGQSSINLKSYLQECRRKVQSPFENIWVFVGSEGGFSLAEVERFRKLDLQPVTLGDQVLRVETACQTIVAALKYEFDLL